jgi:hypothetical protein
VSVSVAQIRMHLKRASPREATLGLMMRPSTAAVLLSLAGMVVPALGMPASAESATSPLVAGSPSVVSFQHLASSPIQLRAVSCASRLICTAVGGSTLPEIYRTDDGGNHWSSQAAPDATTGLGAISCPTGAWCLSEGPEAADPETWSVFIKSLDGGDHWKSIVGPTRVDPPVCASPSRCYEIDGGVPFRSTDGGTQWSSISMVGKWSWIDSLTCVVGSSCFLVGSRQGSAALQFGEIAGADARIRPIAAMPFSSTYTPVLSSTCTSLSYCVVAITNSTGPEKVLITSDGGVKWLVRTLPAQLGEPGGVACASPGDCVLIGGSHLAATTINDGRTWSAPRLSPSLTDFPPAVSCRQGWCFIAEGSSIFVRPKASATWTRHDLA